MSLCLGGNHLLCFLFSPFYVLPMCRGEIQHSCIAKTVSRLSPFQSCLYTDPQIIYILLRTPTSSVWECSQDRGRLYGVGKTPVIQLQSLYLDDGLNPGDKKQEAHLDHMTLTNFASIRVNVWFLPNFYMSSSSCSEFKRKDSVINCLP